MGFDINQLNKLILDYIAEPKKGRLKEALSQFKVKTNSQKDIPQIEGKFDDPKSFKEWSPKVYTGFYTTKKAPYFMQGDIIRDVRFPFWNPETKEFEKGFLDAVIVTNTCDMDSTGNSRILDKDILFAPIVPLKDFIQDLSVDPEIASKVPQLEQEIKDQQISNIFYLPESPFDPAEYIASLDQLTSLPAEEFKSYLDNVEANRIISLDLFGFYLFAVKLSYHLCRLPEDSHRFDWSE